MKPSAFIVKSLSGGAVLAWPGSGHLINAIAAPVPLYDLEIGESFEHLPWLYFKSMVARVLVDEAGMGWADGLEFADSLDWSFEELRQLPLAEWEAQIRQDCQEWLADKNRTK